MLLLQQTRTCQERPSEDENAIIEKWPLRKKIIDMRRKRREKNLQTISQKTYSPMNYLFAKTSNQKHDIKIFITDYGATSHMLNSEDNMTNLKDTEKNSP